MPFSLTSPRTECYILQTVKGNPGSNLTAEVVEKGIFQDELMREVWDV